MFLAVFGPAATQWYRILQRHINLKSRAGTTIARVAADQMVFAPIQLTCFLSSMSIMEGSDVMEKLRHSWVPSYKANLLVWPFVQAVNFTFVPLDMRVLVVNVVSLGEWVLTFLTVIGSSLCQFCTDFLQDGTAS
jgi:protein Mpv17